MAPSDMAREIADQPACWRKVAAMGAAIEAFFAETGGRMAFVGCGTSLHMAAAIARLREEAGRGASDPFPASEVPFGRRYPWALAVSRTGTTTEVIRALESMEEGARRLVITADGGSPLAKLADRLLVLDFADEQSVVQTRFATSVVAAMRLHLGHDLESLAVSAEAVLEGPLPEGLRQVEKFVFLGQGWCAAVASEAALKIREAAGAMCESYPALEYRHGPISAGGPGTLVWTMGPIDPELIGELGEAGITVRTGPRDALAELVVVQRAAEWLAREKGRDPDAPPMLGRSVILG